MLQLSGCFVVITLSKEIERIHKRALRAVSCDFYSSYETLLISSGCKRIHEIHIYHILCEVYKTLHNLNPSFMQALFRAKPLRYSFRNANLLLLPVAKSQRFSISWRLFVECSPRQCKVSDYSGNL